MQGWPGPSDLPPPPPLRPRSVGEILEAAFNLYGKHWKSLIQIAAIAVIPLTIVQYGLGDAVGSKTTTNASGHVTSTSGGVAAASVLVSVLALLIQVIVIGAIAWAVATALVGREPDVGESYRYGYRRLWTILLVGVLYVLVVFAGFIALIVPGIIFAVRFSVSVPAVVVERRRGTDALGRSWNLTRGRSWSVFGAFIVAAFLAGIVNGLFTAFGSHTGWFLAGLLAGIASSITTPFTGLVLGLVYFDLRVRKEQLDLGTLDRELQAASSS
ncbi:MAG: hypothetical protein ACXVP7_11040 [Actinomycetota bacterium]